MQHRKYTRRFGYGSVEPLEARRLLSAGQLDPSFGTQGKVVVDFHGLSVVANAVATQSDGKTVIAGWTEDDVDNEDTDQDFAVVRLNVDGSLDKTFGPDHTGIVTTHIGGDNGDFDGAYAVAIQGDGKIVIAGTDNTVAEDSSAVDSEMYVLRYNTNGTLDKTFNGNGIRGIDLGFLTVSKASTMTLQSDGKIVVAGFENDHLNATTKDIGVARLNTNGSLDGSFGDPIFSQFGQVIAHTGETIVGFGDDSFAHAITVDDNFNSIVNPTFGTITIVGETNGKFAVARLTSGGQLDTRFSGDGMLTTSIPNTNDDTATGVVAQPGGKLVVSGYTGKSGGSHVFSLVRFNSDGTIDKSFGGLNTGWSSVGFGGDDLAQSMIVAPNNRLIVGGSAGGKTAIAALTPNGVLDSTFGIAGKITTDFGSSSSANGLAYFGGRLVAAGGGKFDTARYFDITPVVTLTSPDDASTEGGVLKHIGKKVLHVADPATMIVSRDQSLPFATRVFFTLGGTANAPTLTNGKRGISDYTLTNMTLNPLLSAGKVTAFVDIPAGQTSVTVTFNAVDDSILEPTELATFAIQANTNYSVGIPSSQVMSIIDNDSATLNPTADAYVQDGANAGKNFGTAAQLVVKKSGTTGDNRQAYLKFDLSGLTVADTVKLNLFGALNITGQTNIVTQLFSVSNNSWTETGITFNNKPATSSAAIASATIIDMTQRTYSFDVTAYVQAQLALGNKTVSFALKNPSGSGPAFIFNSREAASNKPTLVVT